MVYIEVKGEKEIPADLTSRLEQLSDSIADLKTVEKELKNKIAIKRGELEMIVQQYAVEIIETDSTVVNINTSERFSKWKDVSEVFDMIPRRKQTIETMTPDIKKIRSMDGVMSVDFTTIVSRRKILKNIIY